MFSEKAMFDTQMDVAKVATAQTVSHVADTYRTGGELLNQAWVQSTVALLVGFVVHGLVVSQVVKPSTGNAKVDAGLADVVKVGTALTVAQVVNATLKGGEVNLSNEWMQSTAMTLAAFFAFHVVVADYVPSVEGHQATVMDLAKVAFTSMGARYLAGGDLMDNEYLMSLAGTMAGFAVFHEVVRPRLFA